MTSAAMAQKIEEILRSCKELLRRSKYQNNETAQKQDQNTDGNREFKFEVIVRETPNDSKKNNPNKKNRFWKDWTIADRIQMSLSVVTAFAVISGVWANLQTRTLVKTAQDTYSAVDRPYIGVSGISVMFEQRTPDGKTAKVEASNRTQANIMRFAIECKNFGSVPGLNVVSILDARRDGKAAPIDHVADKGTEMFPGSVFYIPGTVGYDTFPLIASGDSILQFDIALSYEYGDHTYHYCEREQYLPEAGGFAKLGPICGQPWTVGKQAKVSPQ